MFKTILNAKYCSFLSGELFLIDKKSYNITKIIIYKFALKKLPPK